MSLKHTFVSAIGDGGDATLVRPSNWNADHLVDNLGVNMTLNTTGTIPATTAGAVQVYARNINGKPTLSYVTDNDSSNVETLLQDSLHDLTSFWMMAPNAGLATRSGIGASFTSVGTFATVVPLSTNESTKIPRMSNASSATAGSLASAFVPGITHWMNQSATRISAGVNTGFNLSFIVQPNSDAATVAGARCFFGLSSSISAPTNVDPGTLTNCIGIGNNGVSANLQIFSGGSTANAPIDLGANFLHALSGGLLKVIFSNTAGGSIQYTVTSLSTLITASGTIAQGTVGVNTPAATVGLAYREWRTNNATALAARYSIGKTVMSNR
jgi:hypothetical protein